MAVIAAAELGNDRGAQIDGKHLARLQPALLLDHQALDHRAFRKAAAVMLLKDAEMDQDVPFRLVADDEAEAAGGVEPFDRAAEVDQRFFGRLLARRIPALGDRARPPGKRFATRRHLRPIPLDQAVKLPCFAYIGTIPVQQPSACGISPGRAATIRRARADGWPARSIAASAFSRAGRSACAAAKGPIRRRSAKRSAA